MEGAHASLAENKDKETELDSHLFFSDRHMGALALLPSV